MDFLNNRPALVHEIRVRWWVWDPPHPFPQSPEPNSIVAFWVQIVVFVAFVTPEGLVSSTLAQAIHVFLAVLFEPRHESLAFLLKSGVFVAFASILVGLQGGEELLAAVGASEEDERSKIENTHSEYRRHGRERVRRSVNNIVEILATVALSNVTHTAAPRFYRPWFAQNETAK